MKRIRKMAVIIVLSVVGILVVAIVALVLFSRNAPELTLVDGKLPPCPDTPNCVCSEHGDGDHDIAPLEFEGEVAVARERLLEILRAKSGVDIVDESPTLIRATATTPLLRFVDDLLFRIDESSNRIHLRSSSRIGRSDLGVNRKRVEQIRAEFQQ